MLQDYSEKNWWTSLVVCSRESISVFSLLIFNCVSRAHHQRCSPVLFGIILEHSSSNSTFFQISILSSSIEIIEFSSISRNHTNHESFTRDRVKRSCDLELPFYPCRTKWTVYFHLRIEIMERPLSPRTGLCRIARWSQVPGSLIQN